MDAYLAEVEATVPGAAMDVSRLVPEPCGLDAAGLIAAISDPRLDRLGAGMDSGNVEGHERAAVRRRLDDVRR